MLQLDASKGTLVHLLGIQDHKLCAVCLWHVELDEDEAIVLCSLPAAVPAETWDEDRLAHTPMGVPHLPLLMLGVMLEYRQCL